MPFVIGSFGSSLGSSDAGDPVGFHALTESQSAPPEKRAGRLKNSSVYTLDEAQSAPVGGVVCVASPHLVRVASLVSNLPEAISQLSLGSEQFHPIEDDAVAEPLRVLEANSAEVRRAPSRMEQKMILLEQLPVFLVAFKEIKADVLSAVSRKVNHVDPVFQNLRDKEGKGGVADFWQEFHNPVEGLGISLNRLFTKLTKNLGTLVEGLEDLSKLEDIRSADIEWIWICLTESIRLSYDFSEDPITQRLLGRLEGFLRHLKEEMAKTEPNKIHEDIYNYADMLYVQVVKFRELSLGIHFKAHDVINFMRDNEMDYQSALYVGISAAVRPPSIERSNRRDLLSQFPNFAQDLEAVQSEHLLYEGLGALKDLMESIPDSETKQEFMVRLEKFWMDFRTPVFEGNSESCPLGMIQELNREYLCLIQGFKDLSEQRRIGGTDITWIWEYIERLSFLGGKACHDPIINNGVRDLRHLLGLLETEIVRGRSAEEVGKIQLCIRQFLSELNWANFAREIGFKIAHLSQAIEDMGIPFTISGAEQRKAMNAKHLVVRRGVLSPRPPSVELALESRPQSATPMTIPKRVWPVLRARVTSAPPMPTAEAEDDLKPVRRSKSAASAQRPRSAGARSAGLPSRRDSAGSLLEYSLLKGELVDKSSGDVSSDDERDVDFCGQNFSL